MKNCIRLNEAQLNKIVSESVKKVLKEDYAGNYIDLIKKEMHNLYDLSLKVPQHLQSEIYSMVISLQAMIQQYQQNMDIDNWNN